MKTLVAVHVYYPQLWSELAACVRNIDGACDLVVTYVDEAAVQGARRDFPEARFLKCENRGYDIWPFVAALQASDLSAYDAIVKLHTKRDVESDITFGRGSTWLGRCSRRRPRRFVRFSKRS